MAADQIIDYEAEDGSNGRDALKGLFANIKDRACELKSELIRQKAVYKTDPDNEADNFADHLKACQRVLHSLQQVFYSYEVELGIQLMSNCVCDNPHDYCRVHCRTQSDVSSMLGSVQDLIWESWLNDLKERGEKQMLREIIQVVEGLPAVKITDIHLNENIGCPLCLDFDFDPELEECCHLPCNEGRKFHRICIERWFKLIAEINDQACELRNEIIRQKNAYEADRDNQADNFARQLYRFLRILESMHQQFYCFEADIDNCICVNPGPECKRYRDPLNRVKLIFVDLIDLIWECWSDDLRERVERQIGGEMIQVVEGLLAVKITDNHINACGICLCDFEVAEEPCQLPCNEGHIFHRDCIELWLNKKNHCPFCRKQIYRPKLYFYPAVIERLEMLETWY